MKPKQQKQINDRRFNAPVSHSIFDVVTVVKNDFNDFKNNYKTSPNSNFCTSLMTIILGTNLKKFYYLILTSIT